MTHALHYGTSVFEGVRAYWSRGQLYVFRLGDHVRRLRASGAHYNMSLPYTDEKIAGAVVGLCRRNQVREACYIRPFYFVGEYGINLHVTEKAPVQVAAVIFPVGNLFDKRGISAGIVRCRKFSDASTPTQAKMGGNYLNAVLATQQARSASYDEAVMLDERGNVSEAPGENVFAVRGGRLGHAAGLVVGAHGDHASVRARVCRRPGAQGVRAHHNAQAAGRAPTRCS